MRLRFPKAARLDRASEFARLRQEGVSVHGKFMVLSVVRHAMPTPTRIGFITSRRVGRAVERNLVRRRLREIVRADRPRLLPNLWLVLIARQRAARVGFEQLRTEWHALAAQSGIFATAP